MQDNTNAERIEDSKSKSPGEAKLKPSKFSDLKKTLDGQDRASVDFLEMKTLWLNTGTQCNLECKNCYIESSPTNDRLVYLSLMDSLPYLVALAELRPAPEVEIGFTGGEPFLNPHFMEILEESLHRGHPVLILTNAMKPMQKKKSDLLDLLGKYPDQIHMRVSLDHFSKEKHIQERGERAWEPAIEGLGWLEKSGFKVSVAGRTLWGEEESELRLGYQRLFSEMGLLIDAQNPTDLILFPEMDLKADVPEITTACWSILDVRPQDQMCATSRMVVKRKGEERPSVVACTLLPYAEDFDFGPRLEDSLDPIYLNHPHCARFCVLGGGKCSQSSD